MKETKQSRLEKFICDGNEVSGQTIIRKFHIADYRTPIRRIGAVLKLDSRWEMKDGARYKVWRRA